MSKDKKDSKDSSIRGKIITPTVTNLIVGHANQIEVVQIKYIVLEYVSDACLHSKLFLLNLT